jgi:hypothetical protein
LNAMYFEKISKNSGFSSKVNFAQTDGRFIGILTTNILEFSTRTLLEDEP